MAESPKQIRGTHIASVRLRVPDIDASCGFYVKIVGLKEAEGGGLAGSGGSRLELLHDPGAEPRAPRSAGLFHIALRYPTRPALADALARVIADKYPVQGAADHGVSEAIYLADPSGNGIELTCDRRRAEWPVAGSRVAMVNKPLDLENLISQSTDRTRQDPERDGSVPDSEMRPDIGHIHLQVTDLAESARFYQGVLGLDITQSDFPGALFLSGEGYHHHVGLNVWNSRRGLTLQKKSLGLDSFAIGAAGPGELARIRSRVGAHGVTLTSDSPNRLDLVDPDGIPVAIIA